MLNLDTHVLLHAIAAKLTAREDEMLRRERWSISAIVLWEIAKLAQLGKIQVDLDDPDVVRVLGAVHVWPLTREISRASTELDVHSDPADEIIAATSVVERVPLLTRDKKLRCSKDQGLCGSNASCPALSDGGGTGNGSGGGSGG
jgi:PIN domain nuclease of toxin-antitoxin system